MGVLGTMVVNFTANVQGLQPCAREKNDEEIQEDFYKGIQAISNAAVEDTSNIAKVSQGILDMVEDKDEKAAKKTRRDHARCANLTRWDGRIDGRLKIKMHSRDLRRKSRMQHNKMI